MAASALWLLLLVQDEAVQVSIHTKEDNIITGTTDVTTFTLETQFGKSTLHLKDVRSIHFQEGTAIVEGTDATTLRGKISVEDWKVKTRLGEFSVKTSEILAISSMGPAPRPRPAPGPGVRPEPAPESGKDGPQPAAVLKIGAVVTRTLRSPDGKKLYLLDASDARVMVVDVASFSQEKEIALAGGETSFSISPNGKTLVAGGRRMVSIISLAQGKMTRSFAVEVDLVDVCALDDQTAVGLAAGGAVVISIPKQAIVSRISLGGSRLFLSRDGKKIYTGAGSILLPDKAAGRQDFVGSSSRSGVYDPSVSSDGRFAVSSQGTVYRLGRSFLADMVEIAKVEPHWSSAWAPEKKRLYVVTGGGFVKEYDTVTWELIRSWSLGYCLTDAFADPAGTILYGIGAPAKGGVVSSRRPGQAPPPGDLLKFEIPR